MAESCIPVDLLNPGQVFACLGFMEAAEQLIGPTRSQFDWADTPRFRLRCAGDEQPVDAVLAFLASARVEAYAPDSSAHRTTVGKVPVDVLEPHAPYPFPDPQSSATLAAALVDDHGRGVALEHWGDATRRDNVKFWAGSGGYAGAALARDALDYAREKIADASADPFAVTAPQSSSFRFDWRRDYIPLDAGFSPNQHGNRVVMSGFPVVELMAAAGLTHARPVRENKLQYRYGVCAGAWLPPAVARAALGRSGPPVPGIAFRMFTMHLDWPGQEGQARCITRVFEDVLNDPAPV